MSLDAFDPFTLAVVIAGLSLMPLLFICTTCYLKISVVMMIVRNAIGVQQVPPSIVVYALALALTCLVMAPVGRSVMTAFSAAMEQIAGRRHPFDWARLVDCAEPVRRFMISQTVPEQRRRFLAIAEKSKSPEATAAPTEQDYAVLLPTFVVSELSQAFRIGFILYLPFVVIDLLMSNLLLALGMQMVSPTVISLPLKLLVMVMTDGWTRLMESLALSYL
jgi:type III secretion protein R